MKTKSLIFLLALTFLFLFSGSSLVFAYDCQDSMNSFAPGKDYKTAYKLLPPLAEQGVAEAQFHLGNMYYNGRGVPQDYKEAVKWWKLAAEQHDEQAQFILERMHGNSSN